MLLPAVSLRHARHAAAFADYDAITDSSADATPSLRHFHFHRYFTHYCATGMHAIFSLLAIDADSCHFLRQSAAARYADTPIFSFSRYCWLPSFFRTEPSLRLFSAPLLPPSRHATSHADYFQAADARLIFRHFRH
jgi:hypothetical protein